MYSSQLLGLNNCLSNPQIEKLNQLLSSCSPNTKLNTNRICEAVGCDSTTIRQVIKYLCDNDILSALYAIRCPECGFLIASVDDILAIEDHIFCHSCENDTEISSDDVEVIFTISNFPFVQGQQHNPQSETVLTDVAALSEYKLTQFFQDRNLFNVLYCPTEQEYCEMQSLYRCAFLSRITPQEKGKAFENLCRYMFNCCKNYKAAQVRTNPNELDCYVRSIIKINGTQLSEVGNNIIVECKNENKKPSITYLGKFHSVLKLKKAKLGIIISKLPVPCTYKDATIKIFLIDDIIIISLDKTDLDNIINHRHNLLEMIERKITEIKLDSKTDLVQAGLFDA